MAFGNQVKDVALVCTKGLMHEVDVTSKLGMTNFSLTERPSKREIRL